MHPDKARSIGMTLAVAGVAVGLFTTSAGAFQPDRIILRGTVRDFKSSHPDYAVVPAEGFGHTPGNVSLTLNSGMKTMLTGLGYKATAQWRDASANPIAPHLYNKANLNYWAWSEAGLAVNGAISMAQNTTIDSWDSATGTYLATQSTNAVVATNGDESLITMNATAMLGGDLMIGPDGDPAAATSGGSVTGLAGVLSEPGPLPTISMPTNLGPSGGDWTLGKALTATISTKLHCENLTIERDAIVTITGDVVIRVNQTFNMGQRSQILLNPNSTLTLFIGGEMNAYDQLIEINANTMNPSLVTIYHLDSTPVQFSQNGQIYANIIAPKAGLILDSDADLYGNFIGQSIQVDQDAGMHLDVASKIVATTCGNIIADTPGGYGADSVAGITSSYTFGEWFRDVPGVNASKKHTISLTRQPDGMYEYATTAFHPIDGKLYGNEGSAHNWYFSYEVPAKFTYEACTGQTVVFQGDDDAWLYIAGHLVLDLGGMLAGVPQVIELDRLGLTDGQEYDFRLFYAQRQGNSARFRIRTNIALEPDPYSVGIAGFPDFD